GNTGAVILGLEPKIVLGQLEYDIILCSRFGGNKSTYIISIDAFNEGGYDKMCIIGGTRSDANSFYPTTGAFEVTPTAPYSYYRNGFVSKLFLTQNELEIEYNTYLG